MLSDSGHFIHFLNYEWSFDGDVEYNSEVLLVHVMSSHLLRSFSAGILVDSEW